MRSVFQTCKQSKWGSYWSNKKLLGINDHVTAEHTSTYLINFWCGSNNWQCPKLLYKNYNSDLIQ